MDLFDYNSFACSRLTTRNYSTSFSMAVRLLNKDYRWPIYALYGFVRYADEIVDTLHQHNKQLLLEKFSSDTFEAIQNQVSTNPILHSFQYLVNNYKIEEEHIRAFFYSMEMDLGQKQYSGNLYTKYICGSAEVVGLMCLRIFYRDDDENYENLKPYARKLGEAFQKVNFLRDIRDDYEDKGRVYFPGVDFHNFTDMDKKKIEEEIESDFSIALQGIHKLRKEVQFGVLLAYLYYKRLFEKIKASPAHLVATKRFRLTNFRKIVILLSARICFVFWNIKGGKLV